MNQLDYFSIIALSFVFLESYLTANKLWSRKHIENVAESISLTARLISIVTLTLLIIDNYSKNHTQGLISALVWLSVVLFQMAVGSGLWVRGIRSMSLLSRLKLYILKERKEVSHLVKGIINPAADDLLVNIMVRLALLDNELDQREQRLVEKFSSDWNIKIDWEKARTEHASNENINIISLRKKYTQYLDTSPPVKQVLQFSELIKLIVHSDDKVASNENTIVNELAILTRGYTQGTEEIPVYDVAIIPQTDKQRESIPVLLSGFSHLKNHYGDIFVASERYSKNYADILCQEYRELGFVALVIEPQSL